MKISYKIAIPIILLPMILIGSLSLWIIFSLNESREISTIEEGDALEDDEEQAPEDQNDDPEEENDKDVEEEPKEETPQEIDEKQAFIDDLRKDVLPVSTNPNDYNFNEMDDVSQDFAIPDLSFHIEDNTLFIGTTNQRGSLPAGNDYVTLFNSLNLTDIVILDSIENLPQGFLRGGGITNLYLGDTITDIDAFAATGGALEKIQFGEEVTRIGRYAFTNNELQGYLAIPPKVSVIEKRSFSFNHIDYVDLSNVEEIEDNAFSFNNLVYLDIPDTTERIGKTAFLPKSFNNQEEIHIRSVSFGENLRIIEREAFMNQQIPRLEFPETLEFLGDGAFRQVPVETLVIPSEEVIMGNRVFTSNIENVDLSGKILASGHNTIQDLENYILVSD